jgi:DNA-binding NarL/FixJ family response regulator
MKTVNDAEPAGRTTKTTVLLADDHTMVRQGVRAMLRTEPDIAVAGEAGTGAEAVRLATRLKPDVVVMDIVMPKLNGLEAARQISRRAPASRVVMFSAYSDTEYVQASAEAGAVGYVLKDTTTTSADLVKAIREIRRGNAFLSPPISKCLIDSYRDKVAAGTSMRKDLLTGRQKDVLRLIAAGRANKQIAAELNISIKTVQCHRQLLMDRLNIHNTAGLTRYAVARGFADGQQFASPRPLAGAPAEAPQIAATPPHRMGFN